MSGRTAADLQKPARNVPGRKGYGAPASRGVADEGGLTTLGEETRLDSREQELRAGLSRFLAAKWRPGAEAAAFAHIPGGASRETWRFRAR